MSTTTNPAMRNRFPHIHQENQTNVDISQLNVLAVRGLVQMFDSEKQLFCYRLKLTKNTLVREGISPRYTIISLLGLRQLEGTGLRSPIETKPVLDGLLKNPQWINNIGDLGLLLWLCALASPERLEEIYFGLDVKRALTRYRDAREGRTMELAWFLSGLAHATLACAEHASDLADTGVRTYKLIKDNQGEKGLFGHLARGRSPAGLLRARIGSFADQVYPIYALAKFHEAFNNAEAIEEGVKCAAAICRAQGPTGQWWWHYSSSTGKIVSMYPVYAVHQHGMAPMALWALGRAAGVDYSPWIYKGVQWIGGNNALRFDMRDPPRDIIWRCIFQKGQKIWVNGLLGVLGIMEENEPRTGLAVKFECRPYELGWLLYALAGHNSQ